jgi:coniferyl-aldehyde dehydrogenase
MIVDTEIAPATLAQPAGLSAATILARQSAAFRRDGAPSLIERRNDLTRLARATKEAANEIVQVISADFGNRSQHETLLAEVWPVLAAIRHTKKHLPKWVKPRRVAVPLEMMPGRARILYQPAGVVGIISPWNYPFQLAIIPLANALAAGNRIMLKPSELTPRTSEFLATFLGKLYPREKVAVVLGGPDVAAEFAGLPFNHLIFTGSTSVGRKVMRAAAENLTPVTLELGGKSPCIIGEDAALETAAKSIAFGKFLNAGQTCIAPDYVLVPQARLEDFVTEITKAVPQLYPKLQSNPDYTTIIDERHYRRLQQYLEEAKARGARLIEINPANEEFVEEQRKFAPTLVVEPDDALALMNEEIFGPVLPIKTYAQIDDAINFVNDRPRPLALYYFGADREACEKVLARTTSGGVSVNDTMLHVVIDELPFGGTGPSGIGAYHGEIGFQTFSHRKSVFVQSRFGSASLLRPPFGRFKQTLLNIMMRR